MQKLLDVLSHWVTLSSEAEQFYTSHIKRKELPKGTILIEQNSVCRYIHFLEKGFARNFFYENGKDVTVWFGEENEFITSMYSFVTQKPGIENAELLEDSIIYSISYPHLQHFYKKFPEYNLLGRLIIEKYYIELEERSFSLQFLSAKERYEELISKRPQILQRASLGQIASYLGISQETLSRIRNKK